MQRGSSLAGHANVYAEHATEEVGPFRTHEERIVAILSGLFGGLALLIAALGLYGLTSYTVGRRVTEIGIRMALGAQRRDVLGLILRHSLALTAIGIVLSLAGAAAATRYLRGMLFGLTPVDPGTFIGVAVLFAIVAAVAASIPSSSCQRGPRWIVRNDFNPAFSSR